MTAVAGRRLASTGPRARGADGRLRIAFVYDALYPYVVGGGERRFHELATRLAERHDVHFVSWQFWDGPPRLERDGMTFHGVGKAPGLYGTDGKRTVKEAASFAARALLVLLRNRWDVIDCSATPYVPLFSAALAGRLRGTPVVATWHECRGDHWDAYLPHRPVVARVARWIEAASTRLGNAVVPVSDFTRRRMGRPGARVVANGLPLDLIRNARPHEERCDVLFAGRLIDEKRVDVLIDAIATLTKQWPEVRCTIVGDGPERATLERQCVRVGVTGNVRFVGWLESPADVYRRMKTARVFAMPSVREGFGLAVIEAQACGAVPVVVRSAGSAAVDLVEEGVDGLACDADAASLAAAIGRLLSDEGSRAAMAARARRHAERWSWDRLAVDIEQVYRRLASGRRTLEEMA
jgi:glycosyltransferase involved in cell wall biosynthesis